MSDEATATRPDNTLPSCRACRWWCGVAYRPADLEAPRSGMCRRRAPVYGLGELAMWPITAADARCGEFEAAT